MDERANRESDVDRQPNQEPARSFLGLWGCGAFFGTMVLLLGLIVREFIKGTAADTFDPPLPDTGFQVRLAIFQIGVCCVASFVVGIAQQTALERIGVPAKWWIVATLGGVVAGI